MNKITRKQSEYGEAAGKAAAGEGSGQSGINLTLSYPPSANRYWRKTRQGRIYISPEALAYRDEVLIKTLKMKPLSGDLSLTARLYRPQKSGDLDNRLKILIDAAQGRCFEDDKQIVEIHAYRFDDKANPRVEIEIKQI